MNAKVSAVMRWVGPAAILGAAFYVVSDQLGLVTHYPDLVDDAAGYHAVGSGLFLLVFTLLLVGMFGLYARRSDPGGPKVIEYGDARARYVLVTEPEEEPLGAHEPAGVTAPIRRGSGVKGLVARRHGMVRRQGEIGMQRTARTHLSGSAQQK